MPQLKETIKELMSTRGWTGRELAQKSSQKTSDIYNILSGKSKKPSADKVEAIARAFGVSISTIIHGAAEQQDKPEFIRSDEEWDGLLYNDAMSVVREVFAKRGKTFQSREDEKNTLMRFTMRVYTYAKKRKELTADIIFAEDIISQEDYNR